MKKRLFSESGFVFLFIFSACLVNLAVMALAVKIVNLFVVVDYFTAAVVRLISSVVTVSGTVGAIVYFISYRKAEFEFGLASGAFWIATLLQLLLSVLFKFYPFIGGGSLYLAGFLEHGRYFDSLSSVEYIGIIDYLLAFVILALFNFAVYLLCGKLGAHKRLYDREKLLSEKK
ncbi:MAG: hypothetical protein IJV72_05315 [Clostridia bacterium]|nr:hypothetical protein [Clostridia bacterium]